MCCLCGLAEKADDIPDQVTHEVVAAEPPYVLIKWKEPQSPNGLIILYEVFYGKVGDAEVSVDQLLQSVCVCARARLYFSSMCVCLCQPCRCCLLALCVQIHLYSWLLLP